MFDRYGLAAAVPAAFVAGGGGYWLTADPILAGTLGGVYALAAALTPLLVRRRSALGFGEWNRGWTAAGTAVALGSAVGVHYGLPLSSAYVFALQALVLGAVYDGLLVGVGTVLADLDGDRGAGSPDAAAADGGRAGGPLDGAVPDGDRGRSRDAGSGADRG